MTSGPSDPATPGTPSSAPVPARQDAVLDRVALERVLARAAELQAHQADVGDHLTESQLIEIGRDVGISTPHLRQALAEERGRLTIPREEGFEGRVAGPAVAIASRTVKGTPDRVMAALLLWMEREECLQVKRRFSDRSTWEAKKDFVSSVRRGFNLGGRGYALAKATEVGATVVPVDEGRVLVRLDADFRPARRARVIGGGAAAVGGTLAGAAPLMIGAAVIPDPTMLFFMVSGAIAAAGTLGGVFGGLGIARTHRSVIERAQLALEQILDGLEREEDAAARLRLPGVLDAAERLLRDKVSEIQTRSTWPRSKP